MCPQAEHVLNTVRRIRECLNLNVCNGYRPALVARYHKHLNLRRAEDPAISVLRLTEIKILGYRGSLIATITQGCVEGHRPISPRRLAELMLTHPGNLIDKQRCLRDDLSAAYPEIIDLTDFIRDFAELLGPTRATAGDSTKTGLLRIYAEHPPSCR